MTERGGGEQLQGLFVLEAGITNVCAMDRTDVLEEDFGPRAPIGHGKDEVIREGLQDGLVLFC